MAVLVETSCKETAAHAAMRMIADEQCISVILSNSKVVKPDAWHVANDDLKRDAPTIVQADANRFMVLMPLTTRSSAKQFVLGFVSGKDKALIAKMANTAWQHASLQSKFDVQCLQLDGYADQVLNDFTQFDWMQNLIRHLDRYSALESFADNVRRLLDPLRELVHARALAFVPADQLLTGNGDKNHELPGVWIAEEDRLKPVAARLLNRYGQQAVKRVAIRNRFVNWADSEHFPEINGFMMVAIVKNNHLVGWLLAVDSVSRMATQLSRNVHIGEDSLHTDQEFSTGDAMLLQSAASLLATHDQNQRLITGNKNLSIGVIRGLANAVDAKDPYTHGHSDRVARMAQHLASRLTLDERSVQRILVTGLLHDVGKIGVPDAVLSKPGKLTDEEFDLIKQHPVVGFDIIQPIEELQFAREGVLHHHESYDGRGYPHGLKGQEIPHWARILAVADAFDAMTSDRPYRKGMKWEVAEEIIRSGAGSQWDPEVVAAFDDQRLELRLICENDAEIRDHCYELNADSLLPEPPTPAESAAVKLPVSAGTSTTAMLPSMPSNSATSALTTSIG